MKRENDIKATLISYHKLAKQLEALGVNPEYIALEASAKALMEVLK